MYKKITAVEAKKIMDSKEEIKIIDVRNQEELAEGFIDGSLLIPLDVLEAQAEMLIPDKSSKLLVYCRSGKRSQTAAEIMDKLGYTNVYDFGGIIDWPFDIVM